MSAVGLIVRYHILTFIEKNVIVSLPRDAIWCKERYRDSMVSVCLSVTLVDQDHIGWKSWKQVARTTPSLFVAQRLSTYSEGNMGKFWGERLEVGWEKVPCWSTKAAVSLKRVKKMDEKLIWRAHI